jgi:hypothetical protein
VGECIDGLQPRARMTGEIEMCDVCVVPRVWYAQCITRAGTPCRDTHARIPQSKFTTKRTHSPPWACCYLSPQTQPQLRYPYQEQQPQTCARPHQPPLTCVPDVQEAARLPALAVHRERVAHRRLDNTAAAAAAAAAGADLAKS